MKKIVFVVTALCLLSCKGLSNDDTRWQRVEFFTDCRHSEKFNACFCVISSLHGTALAETGITFAPDSACDGEEVGAIPQ